MIVPYTSNKLTHFIGRACSCDDERYDLLIEIVRNGQLRASGISGISTDSAALLSITGNMKISDETAIQGQIVCFCDIPTDSLGLHISKYSHFGVTFSKAFLVAKGANPVFYVVRDAVLSGGTVVPTGSGSFELKQDITRAELLDRIHTEAMTLSTLARDMIFGSGDPDSRRLLVRFEQLLHLLLYPRFLAFIKPFDSTEPDESSHNFYMEREWRVYGDVLFQLADVSRVILPQAYVSRFKNEFPDFVGELWTPSTQSECSDRPCTNTP